MSYAMYYDRDKELKNSYVYAYDSGNQIEFVVCKITNETDKTLIACSDVCEEVEVKKEECLKFGNNCYLDITQQN